MSVTRVYLGSWEVLHIDQTMMNIYIFARDKIAQVEAK